MSGENWVAVVLAFLAFMTASLAPWLKYRQDAAIRKENRESLAEVARTAAVAAERVTEVKDTLVAANEANGIKLDGIAKTGEKVLHHVNAAMGHQLKSTAVALRRVADLTKRIDPPKYAEAVAAADAADREYEAHAAEQAKIDEKVAVDKTLGDAVAARAELEVKTAKADLDARGPNEGVW